MKIKTKLTIGLSFFLFVVLFLILVGYSQVLSSQEIANDLEAKYKASSLASQIQQRVKGNSISLRSLILYDDSELVQQELEDLQKESETLNQDIELLDSMTISEEQRLIVDELKSTNQSFGDYIDQVINQIQGGNKEEAIHLVRENGNQIQENFTQLFSRMTDTYEEDMVSSLQTMKVDFREELFGGNVVSLLLIIIGIGFVLRVVWKVAGRLRNMSGVMLNVANGTANLQTRIEVRSNDEIDVVASSFNQMAATLAEQLSKEKKLSDESQKEAWIKTNIAEISTELNGMYDLESITQTFLSKVVPLVEACQAVIYLKEQDEPVYTMHASFAFLEGQHPIVNQFSLGEGLVGQAALEKSPIHLSQVPANYMRIRSGLGKSDPLNLNIYPAIFKGEVEAVVEIASFHPLHSNQQIFLEEAINHLGLILDGTRDKIQLAKSLEESQVLTEELQVQSEELQSQQEELKATNEELESQTGALQQSEEKLQHQQEELEQTNSELMVKAESLEVQNRKLELTHQEMTNARMELEEKAKQLLLTSKYKSEFLANMSHELRTPLNSLLILSKLLADNRDNNLTDKQVEFSRTIHSSGCDLLNTINDILDLAKVESGKMEVNPSHVYIKDITSYIEQNFRVIAAEKKINFKINLKEDVPLSIHSDEQRIEQVLSNLLSNAFKFTHQGEILLEIDTTNGEDNQLVFSIKDSGIGIPKDKQELIFQAFQQADGTTNRKYGGTGLGLSICREVSAALGGEITVDSIEGEGSTFTFKVGDYQGRAEMKIAPLMSTTASIEKAPFNAELNQTGEKNNHIKKLLIVDSDLHQRNSLMELIGDKNVIITAVSTGAKALEKLKDNPFDCIILDLDLPDTIGFELLKKMKASGWSDHSHIMIYTGRDLTSKEENVLKSYAQTIIIRDEHSPQRLLNELELFLDSEHKQPQEPLEFAQDKIGKDLEGKRILLVDDDVRNVFALTNVLEMYGMSVKYAENGKESIKILNELNNFDIVLMDIMMPEMDGYEAMRKLREDPAFSQLPIIALTAKAMKEDRELCMEAGASDYIVKPVDPDQLISLIRVWLHTKGAAR